MKRILWSIAFFLMLPALAFGKGYFMTPDISMSGKRFTITGKTNLADGRKVNISVNGESIAFRAQGDAIVKNGMFNGGIFGPERGVSDGSYIIKLSTLKPGVPENEWHTAKDMFETKVRLAVKEGQIGKFDGKSVASAKERTLKFAKKLSLVEMQGRKMNRLRFSTVLDDQVSCARTMHKLQPITDQYHQEAQGLPLMDAKLPLGAATTELKMCVSCSDNAVEHCTRAKEYITEGIKAANAAK